MQPRTTALPGPRKTRPRTAKPLRVMVASGDVQRRRLVTKLLAARGDPAQSFEVSTAPAAVEALVTMHPALLVADLELDGHELGGLRPVLDAVSLGVAAVVMGSRISPALERRLRQLGVGCVRGGAPAGAIGAAIDAALGRRPQAPRPGARSRVQTV